MDIKTISVALVAVMVGAVMFGAFIPIFDDLGTQVTTTEQNATVRYASIDAGNSAITIENVSGGTNLINGVSTNLSTDMGGITVWILTDTVGIRIGADNRTSFITATHSATLVAGETIAFDNGTCTITTGSYTDVSDYSVIYYPDLNGTYGQYYDVNLIADKSSEVLIYRVGLNGAVPHFVGTYNYNKGFKMTLEPTFVVAGGDNIPYTGDATVSIEPKDTTYLNYALDNEAVQFDGSTYDLFFVAPISYHVVTDSDGMVLDVLGIIPLVIGVGLVIMAIGIFVTRKF